MKDLPAANGALVCGLWPLSNFHRIPRVPKLARSRQAILSEPDWGDDLAAGLGRAGLVTQSMIDFMTDRTFLRANPLVGEDIYSFQNLMGVAFLEIWMIFSTIADSKRAALSSIASEEPPLKILDSRSVARKFSAR